MKKLIFLFLVCAPAWAYEPCLKECADWDTFCKSPKQVVATKCRLGVPVYHDQCEAVGIDKGWYLRGNGSLVEAMPCLKRNNIEF